MIFKMHLPTGKINHQILSKAVIEELQYQYPAISTIYLSLAYKRKPLLWPL